MIIKPRAHIAVAAAFFIYVLLIRTYDLANSFLMLGEQTRDWAVALGSWTDLPLTGAPSTAGGRGFGPAYYWILWIGRVLVGPFASNLPHAGGIWIALLQSVADTWLLVVLARRVPVVLALAMCLFIASAPFDISISGVIWNPPVAAALVKMATALALSLGESPAAWRVAITAAVSWLAVQAHLSAIFVAAPLITALVAQPLLRRQWRHAARFAAAIGVNSAPSTTSTVGGCQSPPHNPLCARCSSKMAPSLRVIRTERSTSSCFTARGFAAGIAPTTPRLRARHCAASGHDSHLGAAGVQMLAPSSIKPSLAFAGFVDASTKRCACTHAHAALDFSLTLPSRAARR